jgi:hypothetical protein
MWLVKSSSGLKLSEYQLQAPPVFNGVAVAKEAVVMTLTNGDVICYDAKAL